MSKKLRKDGLPSRRVSTSWTPDESRLLDAIVTGLVAGKDVRAYVRHAALGGLLKKTHAMVARAERDAAARAAWQASSAPVLELRRERSAKLCREQAALISRSFASARERCNHQVIQAIADGHRTNARIAAHLAGTGCGRFKVRDAARRLRDQGAIRYDPSTVGWVIIDRSLVNDPKSRDTAA